jgi:hypothetical protein
VARIAEAEGSTTSSGSGNVTGIPPTTVTAIARWANTTGTEIENSLALVQNGGAIEAQGFITMRAVINPVIVNSGETWIAPSLELAAGGSIVISSNADIIIV